MRTVELSCCALVVLAVLTFPHDVSSMRRRPPHHRPGMIPFAWRRVIVPCQCLVQRRPACRAVRRLNDDMCISVCQGPHTDICDPGYEWSLCEVAASSDCKAVINGGFCCEVPPQCISPDTVSLTESWRNDYDYSETKLENDDKPSILTSTWFRFSGEAGNLMKNECPDFYSCGSTEGAWYSPSALPTNLYETVDIVILERFGSDDDDCDDNKGKQQGRATRCSMDRGGVVYTFDVRMDDGTLCGMN